jgi:RND family efflux transporter MFP subunit
MFRALIAVSLLTILLIQTGCERAQSSPETQPASLPQVDVARPVSESMTEYEVFTGRTQAISSIDLRARVTGYLEKAPFEQGQDVKKGDLLFAIQKNPFEQALKQAAGMLDQQKSQLKYNESVYQRNRNLRENRAASQEELDQFRMNRDASEAGVRSAQAAVEIARQNLEWTEIRAPFDGRISRRLVDPGNDIITDSTILASLVQLDPLYAYFDVDERTLLRIGQLLPEGKVPPDAVKKFPVVLGLANEKPEDFSHPGELKFADNKVEPTTGTLRMWGIFQNSKHDLRPGLFVRVRMGVGEPKKALFIAESALGYDQGRQYVYVVNSENKTTYTPVEAGQRKNGCIAILDGLTSDDRVVVNGLQRVRSNTEVDAKLVDMPRAKNRVAAATPVIRTQATVSKK